MSYIPDVCNCGGKKLASGVLIKDYKDDRISLKKGTPLFVEIISSDIAYSEKYKVYLTIDLDINLKS